MFAQDTAVAMANVAGACVFVMLGMRAWIALRHVLTSLAQTIALVMGDVCVGIVCVIWATMAQFVHQIVHMDPMD